jgi:hypothetical protein
LRWSVFSESKHLFHNSEPEEPLWIDFCYSPHK